MFGMGNKKAVKDRFYVGKGYPGLRAAWYRLMNKSYLDIRIHRGYRRLTRIVTPDFGMDYFTLEGVGTFLLPTDEEMLRLYHDRNALYIDYNIDTSAPGEVVEFAKHTKINYPALSPKKFAAHLNQQTVVDLLSETQKDNTWLYLALGAIVIIVVVMMMFGGS